MNPFIQTVRVLDGTAFHAVTLSRFTFHEPLIHSALFNYLYAVPVLLLPSMSELEN